jgi:hypothetical protein
MNPNTEGPAKSLLPAPPAQPLSTRQTGQALRLMAPQVTRELATLPPLLRTAEVLRFSILRFEHWLSPTGRLRGFIRIVLLISCCLGAVGLCLAPFISSLLTQITGWSAMAVAFVDNIAKLPLGLGKFLLGAAVIAIVMRLLFRR